jgi:predicted Zn-dependent peptidase
VDHSQLANGLRVVTCALPHLHSATIVMYAKSGSRYETPRDNGLSHFLEHMLFRGTRGYPSSFALNQAIESLGGTLHAETGRDYSLYQISLAPEVVSEGVAIFGELLGAPRLSQIDLERQIILEEIAEDLDEHGKDQNLDDQIREHMFAGHGLAQKITGPARNVRRFSVADCRRHLRRFYGASNLVFCVSGRAEHAAVLRAARKALADLPAGRPAQDDAPPPPPGKPQVFNIDSPGAQTQLGMLFAAMPEADPDYPALQMQSRVLDDGMSTRLHYTLCDQKGLAYYVSAGIEPFHDTALFEVGGAASHGKFVRLVREVLALLDGFRTTLVSAAELDKAKRRFGWDLAAAFDEPESMAAWFGGTRLFYTPRTYSERIGRMNDVSAADVRRVAERVLRGANLVLGCAGGLGKKQVTEVRRLVDAWH